MYTYLVITTLVQFDGREAVNFRMLELIDGSVHLGNHDVSIVRKFLSEFVVDGGQLFAVTAPWGVEFNKDILLLIQGNVIEVGGNESLDRGLVPILGQVLGEEMLLQKQNKKY